MADLDVDGSRNMDSSLILAKEQWVKVKLEKKKKKKGMFPKTNLPLDL